MENFDNIRILIIDDHPMLREGLRGLLELEREFEIVGEAESAEQAIELWKQQKPDIALLDIRLPDLSGLSVLEQIQSEGLGTKTIVLTAADDEDTIVQAMKLGASGVVFKTMATEQLVEAIRKVHQSGVWLDAKSQSAVMRAFHRPGQPGCNGGRLSDREHEIVQLVAKGYKNKEIAERLSIANSTVSNHMHSVFKKLNVSDRVQLALYAMQAERPLASAGVYQ